PALNPELARFAKIGGASQRRNPQDPELQNERGSYHFLHGFMAQAFLAPLLRGVKDCHTRAARIPAPLRLCKRYRQGSVRPPLAGSDRSRSPESGPNHPFPL